MSDVTIIGSVVGPFADTLWYTLCVKLGIPALQTWSAQGLHHVESFTDRMMSAYHHVYGTETTFISTALRAFYEIVIVMQGVEALKILSFLGVRFVFDNYLALGYGFGPEIGFINRFWKNTARRPSILHCLVLACSSLTAVACFHFAVPNLAPGASGVRGPLLLRPEADHLLGLSIVAELIGSFFFYAGFMVAIRCENTYNRTLLKLILNLVGVYLVQDFTFDSLYTGVRRTPLRCWAAAASSAFENADMGIFFTNASIHAVGLLFSGIVFGPTSNPHPLETSKENQTGDARELELTTLDEKNNEVESKKDR